MLKIIVISVLVVILGLILIPPALAIPDKFVKDNYIIKFKDGVKPNMKHDWKVTHKYSKIFNGVAVEVKNPNALQKLLSDDTIQSITPVQIFEIPEPLFGINTIPPDIETKQYIKPGTMRHGFDKNPSVNATDGITNVPLIIAVVDTGCTLEHPDLNYIECHDFTNSPEGFDDLHGHGTHVAGTVAAINNGFGVVGGAPGAGIIGLKVCGAGGTGGCPESAILGAWDWLAKNGKNKGVLVSNFSIGGNRGVPTEDGNCGFTDGSLLHQAVCAMTDAGIVTVVSAGNSNADGVNFMACGYDEVICVSAMEDSDGIPGSFGSDACRSDSFDDGIGGFSNYGSVVDISADGVCEPSTVPDCPTGSGICSDTGYLEISGTSMSAPQVTGGVALAIVHLYGFDGAQNREQVMAVNNFVKATGFDINSPDGFSCNKPSGCAEPLLNAETYTFDPRDSFHDVSLSPPSIPNPAGLGFTADIVFTTINVGTFEETYTIELRISGELVFTDMVTLGELQSKNYSVEWIPDTLGDAVITTSIPDPPPEDSDPNNNGGIAQTVVVDRIRDVSVTLLTDKGEGKWVEDIACKDCLRVTWRNLGNFAEILHATIIHIDSGTVINDLKLSLQPFSGVTQTGIDVRKNIVVDGTNTFKAEVDALPDEIDLENNMELLEVIASEENRHYDIRANLLFGEDLINTWNEDESGTVRLWCINEGTETLDNPKLSFGLFEDDNLLQEQRTPFIVEPSANSVLNFIFEPFSLSVGDHIMTGTCDYLNEYDEKDETNNSKTATFTVKASDPDPEPPDPEPPDPEPPDPEPPDTTPPEVEITDPLSGEIVDGKITIRISAEDESGISFVRLTIDGKNVNPDKTTSPYEWSWQSKSKKNDFYIMGAFACDNAGNCNTDSILFKVFNTQGNK